MKISSRVDTAKAQIDTICAVERDLFNVGVKVFEVIYTFKSSRIKRLLFDKWTENKKRFIFSY